MTLLGHHNTRVVCLLLLPEALSGGNGEMKINTYRAQWVKAFTPSFETQAPVLPDRALRGTLHHVEGFWRGQMAQ